MVDIKELYSNAERSILEKDRQFTQWVRTFETEIITASHEGKFEISISTVDIDGQITGSDFYFDDVVKVFRAVFPGLFIGFEKGPTANFIVLSWDINKKEAK